MNKIIDTQPKSIKINQNVRPKKQNHRRNNTLQDSVNLRISASPKVHSPKVHHPKDGPAKYNCTRKSLDMNSIYDDNESNGPQDSLRLTNQSLIERLKG